MGLRGGDDRMADGLEVLRGVAILRGVAAPDMATREARSQMHPFVAESHALRADVRFGGGIMGMGKVFAE